MKILITGASGFVGRNLIDVLQGDVRVDKIYALMRKWDGPAPEGKVVYLRGDLEGIKDLRLDEKVDAVVHLAALMRNGNVPLVHKVNIAGTANVIAFCRQNEVPVLLFTSSINVKLEHRGAYAQSKIAAEKLVAESGLKYMTVRPPLIYGRGDSGRGDSGFSRIVDFIRKKSFFPVFGDGKKLEQPMYIDEMTSFLRAALFSEEKNITLDIAGKEAMTYNDLLRRLAAVLGKKIRLVHIPVPLLTAVTRCLEAVKIPFPLTTEQISHIDEDLTTDNNRALSLFAVELDSFEDNLRKYLT